MLLTLKILKMLSLTSNNLLQYLRYFFKIEYLTVSSRYWVNVSWYITF